MIPFVKPTPKLNLRVSLLITRITKNPLLAEICDLAFTDAVATAPKDTEAEMVFELGPGQTQAYLATIDVSKHGPSDKQLIHSLAFSAVLTEDCTSGKKPVVRIGSLDLVFGGAAKGLQQQFQLFDFAIDTLKVPRVEATMQLPITQVVPGGQDGLPSSEYVPENYQEATNKDEACMEARFTGSAPVVIPVGDEGDERPGCRRIGCA